MMMTLSPALTPASVFTVIHAQSHGSVMLPASVWLNALGFRLRAATGTLTNLGGRVSTEIRKI